MKTLLALLAAVNAAAAPAPKAAAEVRYHLAGAQAVDGKLHSSYEARAAASGGKTAWTQITRDGKDVTAAGDAGAAAQDLETLLALAKLASSQKGLKKAGDKVQLKAAPVAWGGSQAQSQDCLDAEVTLTEAAADARAYLVRRSAPKAACGKVPAPWLQTAIGDAPANWQQIQKDPAGGVIAAFGRETLEAALAASKAGALRGARLSSIVQLYSRRCKDATLKDCAAPASGTIKREVQLATEAPAKP